MKSQKYLVILLYILPSCINSKPVNSPPDGSYAYSEESAGDYYPDDDNLYAAHPSNSVLSTASISAIVNDEELLVHNDSSNNQAANDRQPSGISFKYDTVNKGKFLSNEKNNTQKLRSSSNITNTYHVDGQQANTSDMDKRRAFFKEFVGNQASNNLTNDARSHTVHQSTFKNSNLEISDGMTVGFKRTELPVINSKYHEKQSETTQALEKRADELIFKSETRSNETRPLLKSGGDQSTIDTGKEKVNEKNILEDQMSSDSPENKSLKLVDKNQESKAEHTSSSLRSVPSQEPMKEHDQIANLSSEKQKSLPENINGNPSIAKNELQKLPNQNATQSEAVIEQPVLGNQTMDVNIQNEKSNQIKESQMHSQAFAKKTDFLAPQNKSSKEDEIGHTLNNKITDNKFIGTMPTSNEDNDNDVNVHKSKTSTLTGHHTEVMSGKVPADQDNKLQASTDKLSASLGNIGALLPDDSDINLSSKDDTGNNPADFDSWQPIGHGYMKEEINEEIPLVQGKPSNDEDSHFFAYFASALLTLGLAYIIYHNRKKIMALILEGRRDRHSGGSGNRRNSFSGGRRRGRGGAKYQPLHANLDQVMNGGESSEPNTLDRVY